jgi:nicotinamidase-related amidase
MNKDLDDMAAIIPGVDLSDPARTALMIIDMQYHDAWPDRGMTAAWEARFPGTMRYYGDRLRTTTIPAIQSLLSLFRAEGRPVIHVVIGSDYQDLRDCPPRFRNWARNLEATVGIDDIWWSKNEDFAILKELEPQPDETVIRKTTNGAFNGSEIDRVLQRMGISGLVITGVVTSACVETTARDAADRGYDCILVSEACADYEAEMHDATLKAFRYYFGRVVETADDMINALHARETV